jgi:hypothetical protein
VFKRHISQFGSPSDARAFLNLSLLGRVDPAALDGMNEVLYVEDEMPWFRFRT